MKIVLLSGGSGKRLWPLSNEARSKQFLKIMPDEERARISMLQYIWKKMNSLHLVADVYICTSESQIEGVMHHLGDVPLIVEPERRDTFPAVALASLYFDHLSEQSSTDFEDEVVVVVPVDHFVDEEFFKSVAKLPIALERSGADIVLLGVQPDMASSQHGYIQVGESLYAGVDVFRADSFVEKPNPIDAQRLIDQGALWNCGVFAFKRSYIRSFLRSHGYPDEYMDFLSCFSQLPKRSFDHEIVENTQFIAVSPFNGQWSDIGTWKTLVDRLGISSIGNVTQEDCRECSVINELNVPIIAKGLENILIAASKDGVLIANKEACGDIKDIVNENAVRPMHEERSWGTSTVMEHFYTKEGIEVVINLVQVREGQDVSYHRHNVRDEYWTILEGRGKVVIGGRVQAFEAGSFFSIAKGQWHSLQAESDVRLMESQSGRHISALDIEKHEEFYFQEGSSKVLNMKKVLAEDERRVWI